MRIAIIGTGVVGRTLAIVPVIARVRGPSPLFERLFERRAEHLRIDVVGSRSPVQSATARLLDPVLRFLTVS